MLKHVFWIKRCIFSPKFQSTQVNTYIIHHRKQEVKSPNAAVNGHLQLTLKGRQRFDVISTLNLEVYEFQDWWIFIYFIFEHDESSPNNIWSMVNLERTCVLSFYYFLYLEVNLDLEKNKSAWWIFTQLYFALVNLDPTILEKKSIDGESWPNNFVEKVNRGEDVRWVGSKCPLTRA